jgi:Vacuolar protein sorting 55
MTPVMKNVLIITGISILLACGVLMIVIPSIIIHNYWSLLSIFIFGTSLIFPVLCNACNLSDQAHYMFDSVEQAELGGSLSWLICGILITVGYAVPFELWRVGDMPLVEFLLTAGGGTVMIVAILLFQFTNKREF